MRLKRSPYYFAHPEAKGKFISKPPALWFKEKSEL